MNCYLKSITQAIVAYSIASNPHPHFHALSAFDAVGPTLNVASTEILVVAAAADDGASAGQIAAQGCLQHEG